MHKSGFVNIIGRPNVGKSTLMNALVGERMSIITNKPQTTRHRIFGILNGEDFQIVFSDTPGMIDQPAYRMQEVMNRFAHSTFEDADIMLLVIEPEESYAEDAPVIERLRKIEDIPVFIIINKVDTTTPEQVKTLIDLWQNRIPKAIILPVSALHKMGTEGLLEKIKSHLPEGPAYFPSDQLTDRTERFFCSEIIREKILEQYEQEIPYSCEVDIEDFKDTETIRGEPLARISGVIYVVRKSQKAIIIGKNGEAIKRLGTEARKAMETFLDRRVFLELHVKVRDNWRDDEQMLKKFGYQG